MILGWRKVIWGDYGEKEETYLINDTSIIKDKDSERCNKRERLSGETEGPVDVTGVIVKIND